MDRTHQEASLGSQTGILYVVRSHGQKNLKSAEKLQAAVSCDRNGSVRWKKIVLSSEGLGVD